MRAEGSGSWPWWPSKLLSITGAAESVAHSCAGTIPFTAASIFNRGSKILMGRWYDVRLQYSCFTRSMQVVPKLFLFCLFVTCLIFFYLRYYKHSISVQKFQLSIWKSWQRTFMIHHAIRMCKSISKIYLTTWGPTSCGKIKGNDGNVSSVRSMNGNGTLFSSPPFMTPWHITTVLALRTSCN
jgi:hypothetical protein